ncbi:hypothetical protein PJ267_04305 [Arthrobacter sp. OVS8]|nr:hypothetical protein PJ267_04305 [Arthrobacter sp. OVS8]
MLSIVTSLMLFALAGAISTVPVSITIMILLSPIHAAVPCPS